MTIALHPGTHRDEPDARDRRFTPHIGTIPDHVDLSRWCGPVYQQMRIYSCSANAIASALRLLANRTQEPIAPPSRLFMYYNARASAGQAKKDDGTTMRAAIKAVARHGACAESLWPYRKYNVLMRPPGPCYRDADVRTIVYHRIARNLDHMRACLAQGDPFVFAIQAYPQPFTRAATTGRLPLPKGAEQPCGGHALIVVGYELRSQTFLARNSLGATYARDGFFYIPAAYFTNPDLSYDFWRIRSVRPGA